MQLIETTHAHENRAAGATIAVMFGEMKNTASPRYLEVGRRVWLESMLPVDVKTQETFVELASLRHIEDAKYRDCLKCFHLPLARSGDQRRAEFIHTR
jgi:hypothetical protein